MKISEQQIFKLIQIAQIFSFLAPTLLKSEPIKFLNKDYTGLNLSEDIMRLLIEITNEQSEELKDFE